jgi:hypothetical protein
MNQQTLRLFRPAIFIFLFLNIGFYTLQKRLADMGFSQQVLIYGNILLFLVSFLSFYLGARTLSSKNNPAFFRWIYGSFLFKMIVLAGVAFAYIMTMKKEVNKPALFFCMVLYMLYTYFEVAALMKAAKQKPNA